MKKLAYTIVLIAAISMGLTSCSDYLDVDKYFYDQLTLDSAFSKRQYVEGWLSNAFEPMDQIHELYGSRKFASDDVVRYDDRAYQACNYSASLNNDVSSDMLYKGFEGIRKASTFLKNVDKCHELTKAEIADYSGQMRFLRCYAYWALMRHFGPIPLVPEEGLEVSLSYEDLSLPRATIDELVDYVDNDLKLAARQLPTKRTMNNLGRPTRGAALALRARILTWAASPLMNGNKDLFNVVNKDGTQLVPQEYDESKWARAAAACKEVMDLDQYEIYHEEPDKTDTINAKYYRPPYDARYSDKKFPDGWADVDPYRSYKNMFDGTILGSKNPELIFTRTKSGSNEINWWAQNSMPRSLAGGNNISVTQKQVDAYYMDNGQTISEAKATGYYQEDGFTRSSNPANKGGYPYVSANVSLQYVHREPRFYASIGYNGSVWHCTSANSKQYRDQQIFYYREEADGKQGFNENNIPLTGYTLKKFVNDEDSWEEGGYRVNKTENTIRYAEVLLDYAECLNELTPGKSYTVETYDNATLTVQRDEAAIRAAIKPIRMRAGLPEYADHIFSDQSALRNKLKRERQIEFLGEASMRYYDLRRWKDAMLEENQPIMGCNMNIANDADHIQQFYRPTTVTTIPKIFLQKMYLWPFTTDELKRNVNLTQNPGW